MDIECHRLNAQTSVAFIHVPRRREIDAFKPAPCALWIHSPYATSEKYSLTENLHAKLKVPLACTLSAPRLLHPPLSIFFSEYVISLVISL